MPLLKHLYADAMPAPEPAAPAPYLGLKPGQNVDVIVTGPEQCEALQRAAFERGYVWHDGGGKRVQNKVRAKALHIWPRGKGSWSSVKKGILFCEDPALLEPCRKRDGWGSVTVHGEDLDIEALLDAIEPKGPKE
jgi:hypothetical protein